MKHLDTAAEVFLFDFVVGINFSDAFQDFCVK